MMRFVIAASLSVKGGMHRDDDIVELSENIVGEIERPVPPNVTLGSGKEPKAFVALVELPDATLAGRQDAFRRGH